MIRYMSLTVGRVVATGTDGRRICDIHLKFDRSLPLLRFVHSQKNRSRDSCKTLVSATELRDMP